MWEGNKDTEIVIAIGIEKELEIERARLPGARGIQNHGHTNSTCRIHDFMLPFSKSWSLYENKIKLNYDMCILIN